MDTQQIMCCLLYVSSFLDVFQSHLLPRHSIARSGTLIATTDPHKESGSHWLAIHLQSRSHSSYYFDSYGLPPYIPSIQSFFRRNCLLWDYNSVQLQGPTSNICRKYCCLFALYMDRDYNLNNSSDYLLQRPPTSWFRTCSCRSLGLYEICPEEGSAVAIELKRKYILQILRITRNAYSS